MLQPSGKEDYGALNETIAHIDAEETKPKQEQGNCKCGYSLPETICGAEMRVQVRTHHTENKREKVRSSQVLFGKTLKGLSEWIRQSVSQSQSVSE